MLNSLYLHILSCSKKNLVEPGLAPWVNASFLRKYLEVNSIQDLDCRVETSVVLLEPIITFYYGNNLNIPT